jgi:aromatic ring-cleaving dioxygenase
MCEKVIGHIYTPSSNVVIMPLEEVAKISEQLGCNTYWLLNKHGGMDVAVYPRTSIQISQVGKSVLVTRKDTR